MIRGLAIMLAVTPIASQAAAAPLTVPVGQSVIFKLSNGQPAKARRVAPAERPASGEIKVTVSALMGTTMTLTNNSPVAYTFRAELVGGPPSKANRRTCTLPPKLPTLESWPAKARAVRLSNFKVASKDGSCP